MVRDATDEDWPAIWKFQRGIVEAGDTFAWDMDTAEADARSMWMRTLPGRTFVAVDDDGTVIGSAEMGPNHGGPAAHIANAGFMVDPAHGGKGAGRALVLRVIESATEDGYKGIKFNAVAANNTHAIRLYEQCGFEIIGTVPEGFLHPAEGYVGLHQMYRATGL